jgi:hypothetical protein
MTDGMAKAGVADDGPTKRAPISKPSRNSSTHSNGAHASAIVTIREVIEKTYCIV